MRIVQDYVWLVIEMRSNEMKMSDELQLDSEVI